MTELVTIEVQDHIAHVRLNRPEKMNALSMELFEAVVDAAEQVKTDRSVRAVVLSGEGRAFCAGIDISSFQDSGFSADMFGAGRGGFWPNFYQKPGFAWKAVPVPVICALHGVAFGGGIQIALGADIRIAHPETKLSVMEVKWGLIPDMSGSQTLRDLVRLDVAKELVFTGRILEAPEARELGLVTQLHHSPVEAAMKMAREIAGKNPDAVSLAKKLLEDGWHGPPHDGLKLEEDLQKRVIGSPNQMEAVRAGMAKQAGGFSERGFGDYSELGDPS